MTAKLAQSLYQIGTVISAILGFLLIWKGVDKGTADNLQQIITGIIALVPGATNAVANKRVSNQRADGTLTDNPADKVAKGIQEAQAMKETAISVEQQIKNTINGAIGGALDTMPFGPLAKQVLNLDKVL